MKEFREIKKNFNDRPVTEGAGVKLHRVFGNLTDNIADPFLLLDNFGSKNPEDFIKGFPWHPHRGIETVTYMLSGEVEHEDSLGNKGKINSGEVQWMTAGSGIIHQEMPQDTGVELRGFQLWVNLPAKSKMIHPRYRDIRTGDIREYNDGNMNMKIICGTYEGVTGPVSELEVDVTYMDVEISADKTEDIKTNPEHNLLFYIFDGNAEIGNENPEPAEKGKLLIFGEGEKVRIKAGSNGVRFLYMSGRPLKEPVAWYGPIVMNTREELETAFREFSDGTFLKHKL
jgi:hypothetical protein